MYISKIKFLNIDTSVPATWLLLLFLLKYYLSFGYLELVDVSPSKML